MTLKHKQKKSEYFQTKMSKPVISDEKKGIDTTSV